MLELTKMMSGGQARKRLKAASTPALVATHKITTEPSTVETSSQNTYHYKLPIVVDNDECGDAGDQTLYRAPTALDTQEITKAEKKQEVSPPPRLL